MHQFVYMTAPEDTYSNIHHASAQYVEPSCGAAHASPCAVMPCLGAIAGGKHCRLHHTVYVNHLPGFPHESWLRDPDVTLQHVSNAPLLQAVIPKGVRVLHVPESTK